MRIWEIGRHAFTQLVRMKVFFFVGFFALLLIASNLIDLPQHQGVEAIGQQVLRSIKSWSMGAMTLFSVVMGICATALLLPKDMEDRTLYTILAKPVPRLDYLAGKLLGVLLLLATSLLVMDVLMVAVLHVRTNGVLAEQVEMARSIGMGEEALQGILRDTRLEGATWGLQAGVVAIFCRAAIMAGIALVLSTFSTSTLFTTVVSFLIFFVGFFQADARDFYLQTSSHAEVLRYVAGGVALIFPDFQMFQIVDAVVEGKVASWLQVGKLVSLSVYYVGMYLIGAWYVFAEKEM